MKFFVPEFCRIGPTLKRKHNLKKKKTQSIYVTKKQQILFYIIRFSTNKNNFSLCLCNSIKVNSELNPCPGDTSLVQRPLDHNASLSIPWGSPMSSAQIFPHFCWEPNLKEGRGTRRGLLVLCMHVTDGMQNRRLSPECRS